MLNSDSIFKLSRQRTVLSQIEALSEEQHRLLSQFGSNKQVIQQQENVKKFTFKFAVNFHVFEIHKITRKKYFTIKCFFMLLIFFMFFCCSFVYNKVRIITQPILNMQEPFYFYENNFFQSNQEPQLFQYKFNKSKKFIPTLLLNMNNQQPDFCIEKNLKCQFDQDCKNIPDIFIKKENKCAEITNDLNKTKGCVVQAWCPKFNKLTEISQRKTTQIDNIKLMFQDDLLTTKNPQKTLLEQLSLQRLIKGSGMNIEIVKIAGGVLEFLFEKQCYNFLFQYCTDNVNLYTYMNQENTIGYLRQNKNFKFNFKKDRTQEQISDIY